MKALFSICVILLSLTVTAQFHPYEDVSIITIDSMEYKHALNCIDNIFETNTEETFITSFYLDTWYERIEYKSSGLVVYIKQIYYEYWD